MRKPLGKQLLHGLRLTGVIGLVLLALFILFDGELRIARAIQLGSATSCFVSLSELLVVSLLLWSTVGVWSQAMAAVAFLGAIKGAVGLVTGTTVSPPFEHVARIVPAEMVAFFLLAGLLLMRFTVHKPRTLQKIALITFVFSVSVNILCEPSHVAVVLGIISLLIARFAPRAAGTDETVPNR